MIEMELKANPTKEAVLEDAGCDQVAPADFKGKLHTYCFTTSPIKRSEINQEKSLKYVQNRVNGKIDWDYVNRCITAMESKDKFPALVLFKEGEDYLIADGIHTDAAAGKLGVETYKGIYLFAHPDPLDIAGQFNQRTNGVGESMNDLLEKTARRYLNKKLEAQSNGQDVPSQKDWAERYRVPESRFNRKMRITEVKLWLGKNGINPDSIQHDNALDSIHTLSKSDAPSALDVAKIASKHELSASQVEEAVNGYLDPTRSANEKNTYLKSFETSLKRLTNNGRQNSAARHKNRSIENLIKVQIIKLSHDFNKADLDKFKNLMADEQLRSSVLRLQEFLRKISK